MRLIFSGRGICSDLQCDLPNPRGIGCCQLVEFFLIEGLCFDFVGNRQPLAQIDGIQQRFFGSGEVITVFQGEAVKEARCKVGKFDIHPLIAGAPLCSDRSAEGQHGTDCGGLNQQTVKVERPFAGDITGGPDEAGCLLNSRLPFE